MSPPSIHPATGTIPAFQGGVNVNIWGSGDAPGFTDYYTDGDPHVKGTLEGEGGKKDRISTAGLKDCSVDRVIIRNSPVSETTWDEINRIMKPDGILLILTACVPAEYSETNGYGTGAINTLTEVLHSWKRHRPFKYWHPQKKMINGVDFCWIIFQFGPVPTSAPPGHATR